MTFVDTNILLYAVSGAPEDGVKKAIARSILRGELLTLSIQVLQEFYVQATRSTRHDPLSHEEARETHYWLRLMAATEIVPAEKLTGLTDEANQLVAILTTIVKRSRESTP